MSSDGKRRLTGHTSQSAGVYPGWDRFGRLKYQAWVDGSLTTGSGSKPDRPQLFAEAYGYDRASNRTSRYDDLPRYAGTWVSRDSQFRYDGLNRLMESLRGSWNASTSTFNLNKGSEKWSLDTLSNWDELKTDLVQGSGWGTTTPTYTDTGDINQPRTHNSANELTQVDTGTPARPLAYDASGNITEQLQPGGTLKRAYVHDGWNRLVKVENRNPTTNALIGTLAEYEYNGLHWRVIARSDTDKVPNNVIDQQRLMYYNGAWQLLEEHIDDGFSPGSGGTSSGHADDRVAQNFFGVRSSDDVALRRIDRLSAGTTGSYEGRWFYLTDAQGSTVALVRPNGVIEERIEYSPFGTATYHDPSDFDGNGVANSSDFFTFLTAWFSSDPSSDFNRDGYRDSQDYFDFIVAQGSPVDVPAGWISDGSPSGIGSGSVVGPDNQFGFCNYIHNPATGDLLARYRFYDPRLGRWLQRDPAGYVDGLNLFGYCSGSPVGWVDPMGLDDDGFFSRHLAPLASLFTSMAVSVEQSSWNTHAMTGPLSGVAKPSDLIHLEADIISSVGHLGDGIMVGLTNTAIRTATEGTTPAEQWAMDAFHRSETAAANRLGRENVTPWDIISGTPAEMFGQAMFAEGVYQIDTQTMRPLDGVEGLTRASLGALQMGMTAWGVITGAGAVASGIRCGASGGAVIRASGAMTDLAGSTADNAAARVGASAGRTAARAPTGDTYSVAFQTELQSTSYPGFSRNIHNVEANGNLLQFMERNPQMGQQMGELGIHLERTPTGLIPRTSPDGWTWHHAESPGVMQLVPRPQHELGSIFQGTLHPGGRGGMAIWGKKMTLFQTICDLDSLDGECTIYASTPWTADSEVTIAREPDEGGTPAEAQTRGHEYFLEIFIAKDVLLGWVKNLTSHPTLEEKCARLIQYAVNDA